MQNIDFYAGNNHAHAQPDFVARDPEYFSRIARNQQKEGIKNRNRATRLLSLVLGLCIVSFTSGLVLGIKFTGGNEKEIVDPQTRQAINDIGSRVSTMGKDEASATAAENSASKEVQAEPTPAPGVSNGEKATRSFPKELYPFVIRVGNKFNQQNSQEIADYLSGKGHTVIISRNSDGFFRVYTGPYKSRQKAEAVLTRINYYSDNNLFNSALVLKR